MNEAACTVHHHLVYMRRSNGSLLEQQTVQLRTREMRRFTTTETTTVTITNGIVVALVGGYTTPHVTLCAALRRYVSTWLWCRPYEWWQQQYSTTKGQGVISIRGTTRYYSTINTRRRDIVRTRDEEDNKVRYNDQHCEDQWYCEEEWRRVYWRGTTCTILQ